MAIEKRAVARALVLLGLVGAVGLGVSWNGASADPNGQYIDMSADQPRWVVFFDSETDWSIRYVQTNPDYLITAVVENPSTAQVAIYRQGGSGGGGYSLTVFDRAALVVERLGGEVRYGGGVAP